MVSLKVGERPLGAADSMPCWTFHHIAPYIQNIAFIQITNTQIGFWAVIFKFVQCNCSIAKVTWYQDSSKTLASCYATNSTQVNYTAVNQTDLSQHYLMFFNTVYNQYGVQSIRYTNNLIFRYGVTVQSIQCTINMVNQYGVQSIQYAINLMFFNTVFNQHSVQ